MKFQDFFTAENRFQFIAEIRTGEEPWSVLSRLEEIFARFFRGRASACPADFSEIAARQSAPSPEGHGRDESLLVRKTSVLKEPLFLADLGIYLEKGIYLEAGAMIKGPCIIGRGCQIRHGAYIRGGVITGEACVIGHATEIKNSVVMDHSNAGHFNYLGDSVMGSWANMGAGSVLANLKFRSREEIMTGKINKIRTTGHMGNKVDSGMSKLGAVIGDFTEVGCNTVALPGALAGADCWIYPNTTLPRGVYPPGSVIRNRGALEVEVSGRTL